MQIPALTFYMFLLNLVRIFFKNFLFLFWYLTLKPASQFNTACVVELSSYVLHV